jgi:hypothetical protein
MHTWENFSVGHSSYIAPSQARLTWRFFRDRLPKKKMHLVCMSTLLILLSLGSGYHHPSGPGYHNLSLSSPHRHLSSLGWNRRCTARYSRIYAIQLMERAFTHPDPRQACRPRYHHRAHSSILVWLALEACRLPVCVDPVVVLNCLSLVWPRNFRVSIVFE